MDNNTSVPKDVRGGWAARCAVHAAMFVVASLALGLPVPAPGQTSGPIAVAPAGRVRFYNVADNDFDPYTQSPTTTQQAWMRSHYLRMQAYTAYFDSRLAWYPNAWVYKDSFGVGSGSTAFLQHPEWILRDTAGNMLYVKWGCANGVCPLYAADFGNPAYRSYWIGEAKKLIALGYKGIWVDDVDMDFRTGNGAGTAVMPADPRTGLVMTLANWRRYMAEFMEQVSVALPGAEIAHNAVWYAGPTSDPYVQRQVSAADFINLERGATDKGLVYGTGKYGFETFLGFVDFVHARGRGVVMMDYGTTTTDREFGLAGMLLANQGSDLISSNQLAWTAPDKWWPGYETDLGHSTGARYKWQGLLRRDFQCGTVLVNEPGAAAVTATLPQAYTTLEGAVVRAVSLAAKQAKVLKSPCVQSGGCH